MQDQKATEKLREFMNGEGLELYQIRRNFDLQDHDNVSQLSPYIRYRALYEDEVTKAALQKYPYQKINKFIDEVFWRTYWKGWLEQRPEVWEWYKKDLEELSQNLPDGYEAAVKGQTEIECFDHWARELTDTGYLHNHARMWFASIWIFTLKLPWQLGADFFMANLLDGDAASNTLSWRWVAGIQTKGKTYLARPSNIEKFTDGRFSPDPDQLAEEASAWDEGRTMPDPQMPDLNFDCPKSGRMGLLITESDVRSPEWIGDDFDSVAAVNLSSNKSPFGVGDHVKNHVSTLMNDYEMIETIDQWKVDNNLDHIVTAYCPVGHVRDYLHGRDDVTYIVREYDAMCWPYAKKGFFKFRENIPKLIGELNLD